MKENGMSVRINDVAPNFTADSTQGTLTLHDWIGDSYAILFSHPKDFTPVCTTEFGAVARLADEFARRNTKVAGISVDGVAEHKRWMADVETYSGKPVTFPIIADEKLEIAKLYDMLPADAYLPDARTAADTATVRTTFIIGPDKKIRLALIYPMSVGRNFDEILRALDAVRATDGVPIATPADWRPGQDVIASLSLDDDEARAKFGDVEIVLPYLRKVKAPAAG
jgi:alkyl hydroperoxide reductase subunit AhpC